MLLCYVKNSVGNSTYKWYQSIAEEQVMNAYCMQDSLPGVAEDSRKKRVRSLLSRVCHIIDKAWRWKDNLEYKKYACY